MLLDRIDIDQHGPLHRVELGPFSETLNIVFGPDGSGKTAITRFIRDSLVQREYPLGMMSSSTGRIVWADRDGIVHCRREKDGTAQGRISVEVEQRGDCTTQFDSLRHSWINPGAGGSASRRAVESLRLPESIVDGIITDTSVTNVGRIVRACVQAGLDSRETYRPLPLNESSPAESSRLRAELSDIEAEIGRTEVRSLDYQSLTERRTELHARLSNFDVLRTKRGGTRSALPPEQVNREAARRRLTALCEQARELRARQSELRRWIASLETLPHGADQSFRHTRPDDAERRDRRHDAQHSAQARELHRVNIDLEACLGEAAEIRRALGSDPGPTVSNGQSANSIHWTDRDAIESELRRIERQLASQSRLHWLQVRREHLIGQLKAVKRPAAATSPLAEAAQRWLIRVSGGRLQRIEWPYGLVRQGDYDSSRIDIHQTNVRIDGREEATCPATDRALAAIALRMAAGELLASTGRVVPLVLETPRELLAGDLRDHEADRATGAARHSHGEYSQHGTQGRINHPLAAALTDYARTGRQVMVLTSHEGLTSELNRSGGRVFQIHSEPVVHAHRPLWRPHYEAESYVGPHPHTRGVAGLADDSTVRTAVDINRDFDVAWREAYGWLNEAVAPSAPAAYANTPHPNAMRSEFSRAEHPRAATSAPPHPATSADHPDGYYFADSFTTVRPLAPSHFDANGHWVQRPAEPSVQANGSQPASAAPASSSAASPFFLSVDSPIDQAPSLDAVAAARLRGLAITHINHLMREDSNRLADALGMATVNAATIRRWQAECRLVCRVPQLRGFDARVLVGCGIVDPEQLASIHPFDLLQEVEAFLATDAGQQILLSGTSHELSRITSWIATANSSPAERAVAQARGDGQVQTEQSVAAAQARDRHAYRQATASPRRRRRRTSSTKERAGTNRNSRRDTIHTIAPRERADTKRRPVEHRDSDYGTDGGQASNGRANLGAMSSAMTTEPSPARSADETGSDRPKLSDAIRFFLKRDDAVVDAPSIGPRMAEKLEAIGVVTVDDLLNSDAESIAEVLEHRRVDADLVTQWQQQAELVCRVPQLRGHDAQLLVLAEVTSPEELRQWEAEELFTEIDRVAHSKEGRRALRGGAFPDLQEVAHWVAMSQHQRELHAA